MKKLLGTIKKNLTFSLAIAMMFTGYLGYTCDMSFTKVNADAAKYYDVRGKLVQADTSERSMGDAGIRKPMELIEKDGKWFLRIEMKSLKAKAGGLKGYLGRMEYFPSYDGKSAPRKGAKSKSLSIKSYHDVYDEYNDPKRGSDKSLKGRKYPQYCIMPITPPGDGESTNRQYWIKVYVPLMESLNPGGGTQYARLIINWSSVKPKKAITNNRPDKSRLKPKKPHKHPHKKPRHDDNGGNKVPNKNPGELLNVGKLKDGTYVIRGSMVKSDRVTHSMANAGIYHNVKLKVSSGNHLLVLKMKGMNVSGQMGYLKSMRYYESGSFRNVRVMSYHSRGGSRIRDSYGTNYPNVVGIPISASTLKRGYIPLKVFVPVMDAISRGTGTQSVYLKLDKSSIKRVDANSNIFNRDDGNSGGGSLPGGSGNLSVGSGLGAFSKDGSKKDKDDESLSDGAEKLDDGEKSDEAKDDALENQKEEKKEPPLKKHILPGSATLMMAAGLVPAYRKRRKIFGRFIS